MRFSGLTLQRRTLRLCHVHVSRRRAAQKAQGWMPLVAPPGAEATVRTAALGSLADVANAIAEIRAAAAPRDEPIDVIYPYRDADLAAAPDKDVERHQAAIADLERQQGSENRP